MSESALPTSNLATHLSLVVLPRLKELLQPLRNIPLISNGDLLFFGLTSRQLVGRVLELHRAAPVTRAATNRFSNVHSHISLIPNLRIEHISSAYSHEMQ